MKIFIASVMMMLSSISYALDQINRDLLQMVNEYNQSLPMNVGNGMVAMNMGYIPGSRIITANYQFQTATVAQIKQFGIEKIKAQGKQNLVRLNCTSEPNGEYIRKEGLRMKYSYFDRDNNHIYDIWVTKDDCTKI